MADNKNWPPRRSRFIGGVLYTVDELLERGPDFVAEAASGVAAKSTPIGSLSDDELAAELARRQRAAKAGETAAEKKLREAQAKADAAGELDDPAKMTEAALKAELAAADVKFHHNTGRDKLAELVVELRAKK